MKNIINRYIFLFLIQVLLVSHSSCASSYKIFKTDESKFISVNRGIEEISNNEIVILGETHYEEKVQEAEAWVLRGISAYNSNFQLAWEFINHRDQEELQKSFDLFTTGEVSASSWVKKWFPLNSERTEVYLPMLRVAQDFKQKIIGTNISRSLKKKLMDEGRVVLDRDAELWPFPGYLKDAPDDYYSRFKEVMGEHVDSQTLDNYYLAQFYTDAYMANAISLKRSEGPVLMVVGHFHCDYGHGLPFYLKDLGFKKIANVRLIDSSKFSEDELDSLLKGHGTYGYVADYIIIIN